MSFPLNPPLQIHGAAQPPMAHQAYPSQAQTLQQVQAQLQGKPAPHPLLVLAARTADPATREKLMNQARRQMLQTRIHNCRACDLCNTAASARPKRGDLRGHYAPVPFTGPTPCNLAIVCEAPSPTDNKTGIPLHPDSPAGRKFAELLEGIGLRREHVAILFRNACFPGYTEGKNPRIVPPTEPQMAACLPLLEAQLDLINPAVVLWMGQSATSYLWKPKSKTKQVEAARKASPVVIKGRVHIATYHPAALTYDASKLGLLQDDFAKVESALQDVAFKRVKALFPAAEKIQEMSYDDVCRITADIFRQILAKVPLSTRTTGFYQLLGRVVAGRPNPHHLQAMYDDAFRAMCGVMPEIEPTPSATETENEFRPDYLLPEAPYHPEEEDELLEAELAALAPAPVIVESDPDDRHWSQA